MAIPSPFDTDFLRVSLAGITDVQTIIDEMVDNLTLDLPLVSRWSSLGGGEYKSPVQDPGGANRFMSVVLTRVSATRLSWLVKDQNGNTVMNGTIDIVGTATAVIWVGPYHAAVEVLYGGSTYEIALAVMLDPTPFGLGSNPTYVMGKTRRNSAGTVFGTQTPLQFAMNDSILASTMSVRVMGFSISSSASSMNAVTTAGSVPVMPAEVAVSFSSTSRRWGGRAYQMIVVPEELGPYTELEVPLDTGATGTFEVPGLAGSFTDVNNATFAFRKA